MRRTESAEGRHVGSASSEPQPDETWNVLVVGTGEALYSAARAALNDAAIAGRRVELHRSYSKSEAFDSLVLNSDIAVALIDIDLDAEEAGLKLVRELRQQLPDLRTQLVISVGERARTPGATFVHDYEINGLLEVRDSSPSRVMAVLATSIRAYRALEDLHVRSRQLTSMIEATTTLMQQRSIGNFGLKVLSQVNGMSGSKADGAVCLSISPKSMGDLHNETQRKFARPNEYVVIAGTGHLEGSSGLMIDDLDSDLEFVSAAQAVLEASGHIVTENYSGLYLETPSGWEGAIVVFDGGAASRLDSDHLRALCFNVSLGLENAKIFGQLERLAFYDEPTASLSSAGLVRALPGFIEEHGRSTVVHAVGIDMYSDLVESFGAAFGDQVMVGAIDRLTAHLGSTPHLLGRWDKEVIAVVTATIPPSAASFTEAFQTPLVVDAQTIFVKTKVGVNPLTADGMRNLDKWIDNSVSALRKARNLPWAASSRFDSREVDRSRQRLNLLNDLQVALARDDQLVVQLQPKVRISDGHVVGYESLVRWQHPSLGLLRPGQFMSSMQTAGLDVPFDLRVARLVAAAIQWIEALDVPIAINVSPKSLNTPSFADDLMDALALDPRRGHLVDVEVTEDAFVADGRAEESLRRLSAAGLKVALDDFGTGYSSIGYLLRLPIDVIKIDGTFLRDIESSPKARRLLDWLIKLAHDVAQTSVVVECVENDSQVDICAELGADVAQGYFYAPPLSIHRASELYGQSLPLCGRWPGA